MKFTQLVGLRANYTKHRVSEFFALRKDADPDLPILIEAKNEYAKTK